LNRQSGWKMMLICTCLGATTINDAAPEPQNAGRFPSTHWSHVARAGDLEASGMRDALAALCQAYWYPLFVFIRSRGHGAAEAHDLVQEYFARLLSGRVLAAADPAKGRFRTFLIADCLRFLSHQRARERAQKRGGDRQFLSIDAAAAEGRFAAEPVDDMTSERRYLRAWALTLLDEVLDKLEAEYQRTDRGPIFDRLKHLLTIGADPVQYRSIADELGMTEGAVQTAAHRLRRRYATVLRQEIAATVSHPEDVEDEIRALFAALGP
jgi:RNA polymerase sigma-70 factor (ECF subfamily)